MGFRHNYKKKTALSYEDMVRLFYQLSLKFIVVATSDMYVILKEI